MTSGRDARNDIDPSKAPSGAPPSSGAATGPLSAEPRSGSRPQVASSRSPTDGAVRDAITSIHNFEILLKSRRIGTRLLVEVLPEVEQGLAGLRSVFAKSVDDAAEDEARGARAALAAFTEARLDELDRTMKLAAASEFDARGRLALEHVVTRVSADLDAAVELFDLSERAAHAVETELAYEQLVSTSLSSTVRRAGVEVPVRLVEDPAVALVATDERLLRTDPHVFKRLVALAIGRVHAAGAAEVSVRVSTSEHAARFELGATTDGERALPVRPVSVARRIDPVDAIVRAAARRVLLDLTWEPEAGNVVFEVRRASGR